LKKQVHFDPFLRFSAPGGAGLDLIWPGLPLPQKLVILLHLHPNEDAEGGPSLKKSGVWAPKNRVFDHFWWFFTVTVFYCCFLLNKMRLLFDIFANKSGAIFDLKNDSGIKKVTFFDQKSSLFDDF